MIHFLYPNWLVAAAAVVVPVILHLWNDRRGKVLKVGSVALLRSGSRRAAWSRRLTQWLLLVVRCLLLAALAVLMARPYFGSGFRAKGWVFGVGPGGAGASAGWVVEDSLIKAGWERHLLADSGNYWKGFVEADRQAPDGVPFYIRTPGLASRFAGERPVTGRAVHWEVYTPVDSVRQWVQVAWRVAGDSVEVVDGVSRATGTIFRESTVGRDAVGSAFAAVTAGEVRDPVAVDTSVFRVAIYADAPYRDDGRYVKAAVRALQQYTKRRIEVTDGVGSGGDWLFWLSERPSSISGGYKNIFQYAAGKGKDVRTWVGGVEWMKEVAPDSGGGVWRDGYGRGMLSVNAGGRYRFYSRLNAEWNGLVWSGVFPAWLERLFFGTEDIGKEDRRVLDAQQIAPLRGGTSSRAVVVAQESGQTELLLWGIFAGLLIFERVLSHGKAKN